MRRSRVRIRLGFLFIFTWYLFENHNFYPELQITQPICLTYFSFFMLSFMIFHDQVFFCWFETPLQGVVSHLNKKKNAYYGNIQVGTKNVYRVCIFFCNVAFFIYHTNHQQKHLFFKRFQFKKVRWYGAPWDFYVGESTS